MKLKKTLISLFLVYTFAVLSCRKDIAPILITGRLVQENTSTGLNDGTIILAKIKYGTLLQRH